MADPKKDKKGSKGGKKTKKNVAQGRAYVLSSFNNTTITFTDPQGNALAWSSAGERGFKGYRKGDAGVHHSQPLVLVNHGNASGKELHALSQEIKAAVAKTFAIHLEEEVNIY